MTIFVRGTHNKEKELVFKDFEEFIKIWSIFLCGGKDSNKDIQMFKYTYTEKINMTFKTSGMEISFVF
jgi:hypothetical protein